MPITLVGAFLTQKKGSNLFLLLMSLLFYAWGEPKYIVLLILSISMNYVCGLLLTNISKEQYRKALTTVVIILNLLLLGYLKYFNFFAETINSVFSSELISLRKIALPIGISFYTFQSISYVVDLYRGSIEVQRSWIDLALYISFFPQLVAGPIVKYKDIAGALQKRTMNLDQTVSGAQRFCFGLAKKVLLANSLGYTVDEILSHPIQDLSGILCWTAAIFYTLQIYFDFSGYSDMAIGLAEILGFHFHENFDHPYCSVSIREFWRRWHISLSTWFRDYLYIPLGGNRKGSFRTLINLFIVFFATGLWHGAQWNFVLWGLYHGFFLILERILPHRKTTSLAVKVFSRIYTLLVVCIGWVLFRADNISMAAAQIRKMFTPTDTGFWSFREVVDPITFFIFVISLVLTLGFEKKISVTFKKSSSVVIRSICAVLCLFFSIVMLANATHNPFIYFRF